MTAKTFWVPCDPQQANLTPYTGDEPAAQRSGLLGHRAGWLRDLANLGAETFQGRTVLLTLGSSGQVGPTAAASALRGVLYGLCDAAVRPFCAATHRPFPLQELALMKTRAASGSDPAELRRVSGALVDAGHVILCAEGAREPRGAQPVCSASEVIRHLLAAKPGALFICSDSAGDAADIYGVHAQSGDGEILPLVSLAPRIDLAKKGNAELRQFVHNYSRSLAGGRAWLAQGLLRGVNPQEDYDVALEQRLAAVEYLHLLGVWRNALTGREVSPLEHLHDHCDLATSLQWNKERMGLHVTFDLDVLGDIVDGGFGPEWQPFGCRLQDLGGVLTYLGRTGLGRVLHLISADRSGVAGAARAKLAAHLIYKLVLLREEYSES